MRRTLAYWISIMYLEGSVLFTIGAAFSMCDLSKRSTEDELALVVLASHSAPASPAEQLVAGVHQ